MQNVLAPDCNIFEDDENHNSSFVGNSSNVSGNAPGWPPFSALPVKLCIHVKNGVHVHVCHPL